MFVRWKFCDSSIICKKLQACKKLSYDHMFTSGCEISTCEFNRTSESLDPKRTSFKLMIILYDLITLMCLVIKDEEFTVRYTCICSTLYTFINNYMLTWVGPAESINKVGSIRVVVRL